MDETGHKIGGELETHGLENRGLPVVQRSRPGGDGPGGLQSGVVHGHENGGHHGDDHHDHQPFQIEAVADMNGPAIDLTRGVEERIGRLVERVEELELPAAFEVRFSLVEESAEETHQPSFQISRRFRRSAGP